MCKEVYGYIYMVKNLVNGKLYFGITENDFDTRYNGNIAKYTHNEHLKHSIEKYGIENFEIDEEFDVVYTEDDLWDLEDMYICLYNTLDEHYGYNKQRSGSKHKGHGKHSEESKKKMSENHADFSGEKHPNWGKPLSDETKCKISEAQRGNKHWNYGKRGKETPMYGKKHSDETKAKIGEAQKGKPKSNKHKTKISQALSVAVVCLTTSEVFDSVKKGAEWCNGYTSHIGNCCKGKLKTSGKHPITGEKLHWMYYSDYLKLQEEEQQNKTQDLVTEVA